MKFLTEAGWSYCFRGVRGASFTKIEQDIAVRWRAWSLRKMGSEDFPGNRSSAVLRLGQIYRAIFHIDTGRW